MEPHNHPDYEQTFSRVATVLDRVAGVLEQTSRLVLELAAQVKATDRELQDYIKEAKLREAETTDKLNGLIDLMDRHQREHGKI